MLRLKILAVKPAPFLKIFTSVTGRIAPAAGVFVSANDAAINFSQKDYDAALWNTGAAISSLVLLA